ncbi:MAG: GGDEF domain-containing protein [Pseudomonadota bacterium]
MSSPIVYILVALTLTSAIIAATFYLTWRYLGREAHTLSWAQAFLAATAQWLCNLLSPWFPNFESYWLCANAFAIVVITLGLKGHCQRTNCKILPNKLWPMALVIYGAIVATTIVWPHAGLQTAIAPGFAAAALIQCAIIVLRHRESPLAAEWATAGALSVVGMIQFAASVVALQQGMVGDPVFRELYMHFNFLALPGGYAAIAMFTVFMLASDFSLEMKALAVHDQLTGLYNRRGFGEHGARAYATARRTSTPVAVIVTDIDRFKEINDGYGHATGDLAIGHFAQLLITERRANDFAARLGGEEFALVLPGTDLSRALRVAERLRQRVADAAMTTPTGQLRITASFGVAALNDSDTCLSDVIVRADRAVYQSKRDGRNRVSLESSQIIYVDEAIKTVRA